MTMASAQDTRKYTVNRAYSGPESRTSTPSTRRGRANTSEVAAEQNANPAASA